ncbi:MAG: D-2-hydroxyacid dehydrogenase [Acidimicrobiales bacterium]|nr:D-2-hydroxyacid dehydrogenase [Acidimicrobiales bacterium]
MSSSPVHMFLPGHNQQMADELVRVLPGRQLISLEDAKAFNAALPKMEILVTGRPPKNRWARADNLRMIHVAGSGVDSLLPAPDLAEHVVVTNSRGSHEPHMPEFVMAMALALAYNVPQLVRQQHNHQWRETFPRPLFEQTMCVVGMGTVGRSVARRAKALGMKVVGVSRSGRHVDGIDQVVATGDRQYVLSDADVVVVCVPLTDQTRGLIGPRELGAMRRGGILVDVSRGGVVYLDAVIAALESGQLRGAALDVFRTEPLPAHHPAWDVEGLLITPHVAGLSRDYMARLCRSFAENLQAFETGMTPPNTVNRNRGY